MPPRTRRYPHMGDGNRRQMVITLPAPVLRAHGNLGLPA